MHAAADVDLDSVISKTSELTSSPLTPSVSQKRNLTSPEFPLDPKKNKVYLSPQSSSDISDLSELNMSGGQGSNAMAGAMEVTVTHDIAIAGSGKSPSKTLPDQDVKEASSQQPIITLRQCDMATISNLLMESFRGEMSEMISSIVKGGLDGLSARINVLETENQSLKAENGSLKQRVESLESAVEAGEQYSRRNCLRVSGIREADNENTDNLILDVVHSIAVDLDIHEIDRSHRVGRARNNRPRDIIVRFFTFRARQKLYKDRTKLRDSRYAGVFVNEDLTKHTSSILYSARKLVKERRLLSAWSSNGTILIRDNDDNVHKISMESSLDQYKMLLQDRFQTLPSLIEQDLLNLNFLTLPI